MVQKSERFEMRLDEDILKRVDQWRAKQEGIPSRSEAMRRLIETGLERSAAEAVKFTDGEKMITMMLCDILKHLKIDGEIDPEFVVDALCGGHYWAIPWKMSGLYHNHEDDPRDLRFVLDVLGMFTILEFSYEKLSTKDKKLIKKEAGPLIGDLQFRGFDGNEECRYMGIARFLIEEMDRFQNFKDRDLNSHMPTIDTYSRMLSVFKPLKEDLVGMWLDANQMIAILITGVHS